MCKIRVYLTALLVVFAARASAGVYEDMIHAVKTDDERTVAELLKRSVDVDMVSPEGDPLLILAIKEGKLGMIKTLLAARPKVDARNAYGETAVMLAALRGQTEVVRWLLDHGAQLNHLGWTPLMYAAINNRLDIARILIGRGADVNAVAENGTTPLMMAAREGHQQMVHLLLEHGADVNHKTKFGYSALELARDRGMHEVTDILIKAGAEQ